mmetsp:Transcript_14114/g.46365  ORF Transcript_14114/g.46365 Transcript_14114/m.46365 type:complete len:379 (+) Transcript_14114:1753-2889(+)
MDDVESKTYSWGRSWGGAAAATAAATAVALDAPELEPGLVCKLEDALTPDEGVRMAEARNTDPSSRRGAPGALLRVSLGDMLAWEERLPAPALRLAGSAHFVAVALADSTVHVYTPAGRCALPPIALHGQPTFLSARGERLLAVATSGALAAWDIGREELLLEASISPVLSVARGCAIADVRFMDTDELAVLAVLADARAYLYHRKMKTWVAVAEPSSALRSDFASLGATPAEDELGRLQVGLAQAEVRSAFRGLLYGNNREEQRRETARSLERLMAAARALNDADGYARRLRMYADQLTGAGDAPRLRELCTNLLGPLRSGGGADDGAWEDSVLGRDKRTLLRETVLPAMAQNRSQLIQRLLTEFLELLNEAEATAN